jgi:hypothetical protein
MENLNCLTQTNHLGSSKFGFISSEKLVNELSKHNLELDKVVEMKLKKNKAERQGFQKHRMLFNTGFKTKDGMLQLLVTNSHEGSSALRFQLGFYRFVCSNGLVIGNTVINPISLRHTVKHTEQLNDTISMVMNQKTKVFESIDELQNKTMNNEQFKKFTQDALELRGYDKNKYGILVPSYEIKRIDDIGTDAFTAMNVVQENILRTGFKAYTDKNEKVTMRAIKSLDEQNRINTGLWDLALSA